MPKKFIPIQIDWFCWECKELIRASLDNDSPIYCPNCRLPVDKDVLDKINELKILLNKDN